MLLMFLSMLESDEDRKKFIEIYEDYCGLMERVALSIVKDQHNAEEAGLMDSGVLLKLSWERIRSMLQPKICWKLKNRFQRTQKENHLSFFAFCVEWRTQHTNDRTECL